MVAFEPGHRALNAGKFDGSNRFFSCEQDDSPADEPGIREAGTSQQGIEGQGIDLVRGRWG